MPDGNGSVDMGATTKLNLNLISGNHMAEGGNVLSSYPLTGIKTLWYIYTHF